MKSFYYGLGILFAVSLAFVLLAVTITGVGLNLRHHRRQYKSTISL